MFFDCFGVLKASPVQEIGIRFCKAENATAEAKRGKEDNQ